MEVNINKYNPLRASSYIKLPRVIELKRAVVNVQNADEHCFAWSVISAVFESPTNSSRPSAYPHYSTVLNWEGLSFPVKLRDIPNFEKLNMISINVYGLEECFKNGKRTYEVVGPLYYSANKRPMHVNLLLITDENTGRSHYCWIKNMSRLISSQLSKHSHKKHLCDGCLQYFSTEGRLYMHQRNDCNQVYTQMPTATVRVDKFGKITPRNKLKFENIEKQMKVPFVVYADFESVLKPLHTCVPNPEKKFTCETHKHKPHSFAYYIKCAFDPNLSKFVNYRGADCAEKFSEKLEADVRDMYERHLKVVVPMNPLSEQEEREVQEATHCNICRKPFDEGEQRVKDHCHLTGVKRPGASHTVCNLNFKVPNFIPVFFHNLSGYDCHLFVKEMCKKEDKIDVIAQNKEKYISFTKHVLVDTKVKENGRQEKVFLKLRFLDSFRFMASSLAKLGEDLEPQQFNEVRKHFSDEREFEYMRKKGIFPYSYVDCLDKLNETQLPDKEDFYDSLTKQDVTDEDYNRAKEVWDLFRCQTLGDYSDVYLKSDVLLLADIFENFREICLKTYGLDPAQYFTAPGLSWDAMLRFTGIELELLTDIDMFHFFKKSIRGGISQCVERKHIANNEFLTNFNAAEPSSFIMYLDATNLYGHSMSQCLPLSDFEWVLQEEIQNLDILSISDEADTGYVLEVDVEYPEDLHDLHSDLPFLVENMKPPTSKTKYKKLIPNLFNKSRYVVHYRNLKQAIRNGLKLTKIHRVLRFRQAPWLKPYIDLNTEMRNKATSEFGRSNYKLMNNAIFGKTMENVDKRVDIRLITHWQNVGRSLGAESLIAKPNFKNSKIFSENLVAIQMEKLRVIYDKPLYLGFTILELSKTVMYEFYYEFIKQNYGDKASLLYMDTDSLILKIYSENFYKEIKQHVNRFDTSNFKEGNKFDIPVTPSVVGKMKVEYPEKPIYSFYGTAAKSYFVKVERDIIKKAKGIKKNVIKTELHEEDYKGAVERNETVLRSMSIFTSKYHELYTEIKNKVALSGGDDKRFLIPGTTKTLAWGHRDIFLYSEPENDEDANVLLKILQDLKKTIVEDEGQFLVTELENIFKNGKLSENYLNDIYRMLDQQ